MAVRLYGCNKLGAAIGAVVLEYGYASFLFQIWVKDGSY